jgi:hypothetical protein
MFFNKDSFFYKMVARRANTIRSWDCVDSLKNYLEVNSNGPNLYSKDSFNYSFNNHGFRCDNFENHSDIPILFSGCSYTEGTGLPVEQIWTNQLLDKIKLKTGKNISYWNLAICGSGLDAISSSLYWYSIKIKKPIKYIIILFPPFSRRQFMFMDNSIKYWFHPGASRTESYSKDVDTLFSDLYFIKYETLKNLMLIDSVAKNLNSKIIYSTRTSPGSDEEVAFIQENFPHFSYIKYPDLKYQTDLARDSSHYGPSVHKKNQ